MTEMVATRVAYGEALRELGKENRNVVALDADLSCSTQTKMFATEFPERFFNVGIAEANMMAIAAGLATSGKIPFASSFAVFATGRCYDQIRQSIAYPQLNVKICASHGGITVGEDGASHQSVEDLALMRATPNMRVIIPADAPETRKVIPIIAKEDGPFYVRLTRPKVPVLGDYPFRIGKANVLRDGKDVTIISFGVLLSHSLEAAKLLKKKGISARVVNMHTLKPIDQKAILKAAKETGTIVTAEEHSIIGGLGSAVAEVLSESLPTKMLRMGVQDCYGRSGKPDELLDYYKLSSKHIAKAVQDLIK